MNTPHILSEKNTAIDYSLLLSRLEDEIIRGTDPERCVQLLRQEKTWGNLSAEQLLKWAELAQIAGELDVADSVFQRIHQLDPGMTKAWLDHIELLSILGRRKEAARLIISAKHHLDAEQYRSCLSLVRSTAPSESEMDADGVAAPFESMRARQLEIMRFMDLFSGREDCFARQWADHAEQKQGYIPVKRPLEYKDAEDHILGRVTYGIYILRSDSSVRTAVLDMDLVQKYRSPRLPAGDASLVRRERDYIVKRVLEISKDAGMPPILEFSGGKGFHFWYCFESPIPAASARRFLEQIRLSVASDVSTFNLEVFPKQDHLSGKGYGNLVKLPLGIHRSTGKHSWFVQCHDRTVDSQLKFLTGIRPISPEAITMETGPGPASAPVIMHPRIREFAESWPEVYRLEQCCPPLAQIIASCHSKNTLSKWEIQVLYQTLGFLNRRKSVLHMLLADQPDYNQHQVDYKLSRVRGGPMGCPRIHSLTQFTGDLCRFENITTYAHPLLHLENDQFQAGPKSEKIENLQSALENLKLAITIVHKFM